VRVEVIGDVEIRLENGGALAAPVINFVIDRMLKSVFFSFGI
jgi:hypothetical protein